ncbi:MAG: nitronate monooxygenase [Candidatus Baldrarchaeia archaeon]
MENSINIEFLGCGYPIIERGLSGLGAWELVAAVSEAEAHGCITAGVYKTPEGLREAIHDIRSKTKKSFGVNITIGICLNIEKCSKFVSRRRFLVSKPQLIVPMSTLNI